MSLSEIIQTITIIVSLFIALGGWFINWRQRVNDKKPQMVATVVNSISLSRFEKPPVKVVQLRNIGQSTAIVQEFRIVKHTNISDQIISDGLKNLSIPMFPSQMIDSNRILDLDADYTIVVKYNQLHSNKTMRFEVTLSGLVFRHIDPHQLINMQ
ncbi:hypothetical protein [Lapidilactobacillus bayanensis]|uniref:hypothetical protein n=1 Tax=Lapidilactobacillus bayanensis TaxID=2485998 RepID=UPI000F7A6DD0|nr:hypothetical protein [Lapidilactobacillus bayanensis]